MFDRFRGMGIFSDNNQIQTFPYTDQEISKAISDIANRINTNAELISKIEKKLSDGGVLENNKKIEGIHLSDNQKILLKELERMKKNQITLQQLLDNNKGFLNFKKGELRETKNFSH